VKKISVEKITESVVLAREVVGVSGNVLLNKGVTVSPSLGRRLKNWGITVIHIEGEDETKEEREAASVSPDQLKEALEKKFSSVIDNKIMKKVFAAVLEYRIQKGTTGY
jgi:hypothetical protein